MITNKTVLLVYVFFLVLGGVMGLVKGKSKISLIMSLAFAIPLALSAFGYLNVPYLAVILIALLLVFFAKKFMRTKSFMPGGLMSILSVIALFLLLWKK